MEINIGFKGGVLCDILYSVCTVFIGIYLISQNSEAYISGEWLVERSPEIGIFSFNWFYFYS